MAHEMLGRCPVCDGQLQVARLTCGECGTSIEGRFEPCKFCKLNKENRQFAETFIRCRGNIKEVEKELNISYPTVRGRLESLIAALESETPVHRSHPDARPNPDARLNPDARPHPDAKPQPQRAIPMTERRLILEGLDRGELDVSQALMLLKQSVTPTKEGK